jgi:hypothetical protein
MRMLHIAITFVFLYANSNVAIAQTSSSSGTTGGSGSSQGGNGSGETNIPNQNWIVDVGPPVNDDLVDYKVETISTADHSDSNYSVAYIIGNLGGFMVGGSFSSKSAVETDIYSWSMAFTVDGQELQSWFEPVGFWNPPHWYVGQMVMTGEIGWLIWNGRIRCKVHGVMEGPNNSGPIETDIYWYVPCNGQVMPRGIVELFQVDEVVTGLRV